MRTSSSGFSQAMQILCVAAVLVISGSLAAGGQGGSPVRPAPPSQLMWALIADRLILNWRSPSDPSVSSYQIQGGSDPGLNNLVNFDTFQNATQINLKIGAGSHFIRVRSRNSVGMSVASSNEVAVFVFGADPVPNPVFVIPTLNAVEDFFGDVIVLGEVQNRVVGGPLPTFLRVDADFFGPGGVLIGSDFTFVDGRSRRLAIIPDIVTDTVLLPGQRGCFKMFTNIPFANADAALLTVSFDTDALIGMQGKLQVASYQREADFFDNLLISGTARNTGTRTTFFNKVISDIKTPKVQDCDFTFIDGSVVSVGFGITTDTGLFPGQTGTFLSFTNVPFGPIEIRRYTQWDELPPPGVAGTLENLRVANAEAAEVVANYERVKDLLEQLIRSANPSKRSLRMLGNELETRKREMVTLLSGGDRSASLGDVVSLPFPKQ